MLEDILNTNFSELGIVCFRAVISFIALFLITKLIGKKQVSEFSLFDYVISISIGNFAAEIAINTDIQFLNGLVGVTIFGIIACLVSFLTMKSIILRRFFTGTSTIIMEDGKFIYKKMKRIKLDVNDFLESARIAGYFDVSKIKYAIMEVNGKISFLPKKEYSTVTVKDLGLKIKDDGTIIPNVIIDGKIMTKNLEYINKDEKWLLHKLKVLGYKDYSNILLATVLPEEKLDIYLK